MHTPFLSSLTLPTPVTYQTLRDLGSLQARVIHRMAALQFDFATVGIQGTLQQAQAVSGAASLPELLAAQSRCASTLGGRLIEISREANDLLTESQEEFIAWVKQSLEPVAPGAATASAPAKASRKKAATAKGTRRSSRKKAA